MLLWQAVAAQNDQLEHASATISDPSCSTEGLGAPPRQDVHSPVSLLWHSLGSFLSKHLPGDISSADPGFFNDLRIAFNTSHPHIAPTRTHKDDVCQLENQGSLFPRDQQVLQTKCRVKSTRPHQEWDGDVPNYTPTDSNGRPLPTQTIGDGHGGYGQEVISVTTMCGSISPGANGKHDSPTS